MSERRRPLVEMLEKVTGRKVGVLYGQSNPVDESKAMTIKVIGEAKAALTTLLIFTLQDGVWTKFDILKGEIPTATPGAGHLKLDAGCIYAQNVGTARGALSIRVTDDTDKEIYYDTSVVDVGGYCWNHAVTFDMPDRPYTLKVEVGH